jgi:hypothetical protein
VRDRVSPRRRPSSCSIEPFLATFRGRGAVDTTGSRPGTKSVAVNAVAARLDYGWRYPTPNNPVRRSFGSIEVKKRALQRVSWAPTRTDDPLPPTYLTRKPMTRNSPTSKTCPSLTNIRNGSGRVSADAVRLSPASRRLRSWLDRRPACGRSGLFRPAGPVPLRQMCVAEDAFGRADDFWRPPDAIMRQALVDDVDRPRPAVPRPAVGDAIEWMWRSRALPAEKVDKTGDQT